MLTFRRILFLGICVMILTFKKIIKSILINFQDDSNVGRTAAMLKGGLQMDPKLHLISH